MRFPEHIQKYIHFDEPMAAHTTFKTGGPADMYIAPPYELFVPAAKECITAARKNNMPLFILGGGANLCVSDKGICGLTLDTRAFCGMRVSGHERPAPDERVQSGAFSLNALAGTPSDSLAGFACEHGLGGLEFLAGLPGTIGGALFMNARCFERSVSDALISVDFLDEDLEERRLYAQDAEWAYKKSPFQGRKALILSAAFRVSPEDPAALRERCRAYRTQREEKGHFRFPSAGSVFKNNHAFGASSGALIDRLGLCGLRVGGAQIPPWHGNFIINTGGAHSSDIRTLVERVKTEVFNKLGFCLEEEIIFAGEDWE